jgi:hypothetical protein
VFGPRLDVAIIHADCAQLADARLSSQPKRRSFARWCKDEFAALKPQLRILWQTLVTWLFIVLRWFVSKMHRSAA